MEKIIKHFDKEVTIICDEKCQKAWGIVRRPFEQLSDDVDDIVYLSDDELGIAPVDPETYEGDNAKPTFKTEIPNKWCIRQCERCNRSNFGESDLPLKLMDWSKRVYNQPWKHEPSNV